MSSISAVALAEYNRSATLELAMTAATIPTRRPNIELARRHRSKMVMKPDTALGSLAAIAETGCPVAASCGST